MSDSIDEKRTLSEAEINLLKDRDISKEDLITFANPNKIALSPEYFSNLKQGIITNNIMKNVIEIVIIEHRIND